jgi:hypothetical protein
VVQQLPAGQVRAGERSALSEITVGTMISRLGFRPAFGVPMGTKVPDLALTVEHTTIFVEVIAPDRADIVKEFIDRITDIAGSILSVSSGANVALFLDYDLDEIDISVLTTAIAQAPFSEEVQVLSSVGRFLKRPYSLSPIVSPTVLSNTSSTVLGAARGSVDGATGALAAVRARVFDGRAKRLLGGELHHFQNTNPNVVVIDTGNVAVGMKDWGLPIERCFQPTQNTRIAAVILYEMGLIINPVAAHRNWKIMINPYAANPLPREFWTP